MKVYLLYGIDDAPKILLREIHEALQDFLVITKQFPDQLFSHGLLAIENNHIYRAGVIFDSFDELRSMAKIEIPQRSEGGILGEGIDLSKLSSNEINRSIYRHSTENG